MAEPHLHAHSDSPAHGHVHADGAAHGQLHVHAGNSTPARVVIESRPSWLLHSVAQRLLGAALVCAALVAAMLWATFTQG